MDPNQNDDEQRTKAQFAPKKPDPVPPERTEREPAAPTEPEPDQPTSPWNASSWESLAPETSPNAPSNEATPKPTPTPSHPPSAADSFGEALNQTLANDPEPGSILFGRYQVERKLGQGGMGSVWLVRHLELEARRALKLIVSNVARDPETRARFKREAKVMARLVHPHAVIVHDARLAQDVAFIEMEYIPGKSLNQLLKVGQPLPLPLVARLLEQLCDVLQAAHDLGIVHRDLKPSNLMLLDGRPPGAEFMKVLDFGIAKILNPDETDSDGLQTKTGDVLFTPQYASPEQASGAKIDHRSDLYTLGVILYELLTGYRPFIGPQAIYHHLFTPPPPFAEKNAAVSIPEEVERVVRRCLAKIPEERPRSARELLDLFQLALGQARTAWPVLPTDPDPAAAARSLAPTQPMTAPPPPTEPAEPAAPPSDWPPSKPWLATDTAPMPTLEPSPSIAPPPWWRRRRTAIALPMVALIGIALLAAFFLPVYSVDLKPPLHPPGFVVEDPEDWVGPWPRLLVHEATGARFIRIEGGEFVMGDDGFITLKKTFFDDRPPHPVVLSDFYMQETEVTNAIMDAYFRTNRVPPEQRPARWRAAWDDLERLGEDPAPYPAVGVPHALAVEVANWLGGRLPTEAEWEYTARSRGQRWPFVWGEKPPPSRALANIDSLGFHEPKVFPPKRRPEDRTVEGIFDLTGNVREWCLDRYGPYSDSEEPVRDPRGPSEAITDGQPRHIIRGGSFLTLRNQFFTTGPRQPDELDLTTEELNEDGSASDLGFRIVLEWPPADPA